MLSSGFNIFNEMFGHRRFFSSLTLKEVFLLIPMEKHWEINKRKAMVQSSQKEGFIYWSKQGTEKRVYIFFLSCDCTDWSMLKHTVSF